MMLSAALVLALAGAASAQTSAVARRGDFPVRVKVSGRVSPAGVFRLKSTIEGRVIAVTASTFTWVEDGEPLGMLADKELAAILDAHGTTGSSILEERWQRIYKPTKIFCPKDCFVLKSYIRLRQSIKPEAILFEAARGLRLEGHVGLAHAHLFKMGLPIEFWTLSDPGRKLSAKITSYSLDLSGEKGGPGGNFWAELSPKTSLDPGTPWEGVVLAETKRNTLHVPTAALIRHGGAVYLPVKISTGITTEETVEVLSGVEDGRTVLVLGEGRLAGACPHAPEPDLKTLCRQAPPPAETREEPAQAKPKKKAPKAAVEEKKEEEPERDPAWGPDPYEE